VYNERLKELRKKTVYSQEDVGKLIGVSRTAYAGYEQGAREPDNETLVKMSKLFGVTVDYLLGIENIRSLEYNDIINIPLINSVEVGIDGMVKESFERYATFLKEDVRDGKDYFALEIKTNRLSGDGINPGDIALIEKDAEYIDNKIYAVVPQGEQLLLCHLTKTDGIFMMTFSNPEHKPRVIRNKDDAYILGRVTQLKRAV